MKKKRGHKFHIAKASLYLMGLVVLTVSCAVPQSGSVSFTSQTNSKTEAMQNNSAAEQTTTVTTSESKTVSLPTPTQDGSTGLSSNGVTDPNGTVVPTTGLNSAADPRGSTQADLTTPPLPTGLPTVTYAQRPPESAVKEPAYFKDALFIGDSRTEGLMLFGDLYDATFLYGKGYSVDKFASHKIKTSLGEMTGQEFVEKQKGKFTDIYISFGINETGWPLEGFIQSYAELIQFVQVRNPQANIYVQAILPVAKSLDNEPYTNNRTIRLFNEAIDKKAKDLQVYFLDPGPDLCQPDGSIPEDATADGIHFGRAYVIKWQNFIQAHVAPPRS